MEPFESFDAYTGGMFSTAFFASFGNLCKSSQYLANMRAGLSTRRYSCEPSVSMGVGLPSQQVRWFSRPWLFFIVQSGISEFLSLSWGHRVEEGLHLSQLCMGQ